MFSSARPGADGRRVTGVLAGCACRHATTSTIATSATAIAAPPTASTSASKWNPGAGSARRARPIGMSGDASQAPMTASAVPTTTAPPGGRARTIDRCARVRPSANQVSRSSALSAITRAALNPMTTRPEMAAMIANTVSPIARTSIDSRTPLVETDVGSISSITVAGSSRTLRRSSRTKLGTPADPSVSRTSTTSM